MHTLQLWIINARRPGTVICTWLRGFFFSNSAVCSLSSIPPTSLFSLSAQHLWWDAHMYHLLPPFHPLWVWLLSVDNPTSLQLLHWRLHHQSHQRVTRSQIQSSTSTGSTAASSDKAGLKTVQTLRNHEGMLLSFLWWRAFILKAVVERVRDERIVPRPAFYWAASCQNDQPTKQAQVISSGCWVAKWIVCEIRILRHVLSILYHNCLIIMLAFIVFRHKYVDMIAKLKLLLF